MNTAWAKRNKTLVKIREAHDKQEGRLPYWNDRARSINYKAKQRYYETNTVTGQDLKELFELGHRTCFYCREQLTPCQVHFDHMEPLKAGGLNTVDNLCLACGECNMSKGDDSIEDFLARVYETKTPERIFNTLYSAEP